MLVKHLLNLREDTMEPNCFLGAKIFGYCMKNIKRNFPMMTGVSGSGP